MALPKNTMKFREIAPRIIDRLMADFGLTDFQAAGFPGNFGVETAGFTLMQEIKPVVPGSKGGLGWAQWTGMGRGGRRKPFEEWLRRKGAKPDDFEANYGFLFRELTSTEKATIPALKKARTVDEAVDVVMRKFERPGVQHLARRKEWGRLALDVWRAKGKRVAPPVVATKVAASSASTPEVRTVEPQTAPTAWWERLLGVKPPAMALVGKNRGDEVLFRQQNRLLAAGYTEVGDPDGLWGQNTKTAVTVALEEQAPLVAPPVDWPLSDEVLAALAKLAKREVATERAALTVSDLRQRGSTPIKAPVELVGGGGLLGILGIGKAIQETGIPDRLTQVSDQAGEIMGSLQSAIGVAGGVFTLVFRFWWLILLVLGLWWIAKGVRWALEIRALVRQGSILQTSL